MKVNDILILICIIYSLSINGSWPGLTVGCRNKKGMLITRNIIFYSGKDSLSGVISINKEVRTCGMFPCHQVLYGRY